MRVDENGCFLQYKEYKNLVLYPEISVVEKKKKGATSSWPPDAQEWVITQVHCMLIITQFNYLPMYPIAFRDEPFKL